MNVLLRKPDELYEGDARLQGNVKIQRVMNRLLQQWAERTWNLRSIVGKDFSQRVAATLTAAERASSDPQRDWKYTKGKEKRTRHHAKSDPLLDQVAMIAGKLLIDDPKQYALLCLHYGALRYRDTLHWPVEKKAAYLDIEVSTYTKRISQLRTYFADNWPKHVFLDSKGKNIDPSTQ